MNKEDRESMARKMQSLSGNKAKFRIPCTECDSLRTHHGDKSMKVDMTEKYAHCFHCGYHACWKGPEDYNNLPADTRLPQQPPVYLRPVYIPEDRPTRLGEKLARYLIEERCIPLIVLITMKISEKMEWMPQTRREERCMCFDYFEQGKLINTKFRDGAKHFKLISGAELIPWNIDAILGTETAYITEGEMDAMSLMAAGYKEVISVPNGAGGRSLTWLDRFVESHFEEKKHIILALDTDKQGIELKNELVRRLGADRCRIVKWGPECKDANEHLLRYGIESLRIAIEQAEEIPLEGVFTALDLRSEMLDLYENGMPKGIDSGLQNLDKVTRLETNRTLVISGTPGSGKSEFVDEMMVRYMLRHDWRVAYFSPENRPVSYHVRKILMKLTGKRFDKNILKLEALLQALEYLGSHAYFILPKQDFSVDAILERIASLVRRHGINVAVIDPFNCLEHAFMSGETETQYINRLFDKLNHFAMHHNILLVIVAHPTKMRRDPGTGNFPVPTLYDIAGSAAFYNKSDFGMIVERNKKTLQTVIHVDKVRWNHLGDTGEAFFRYNDFNGRFVPMQGEERPEGPAQPEPEWDNTNWVAIKLMPKQGELDLQEAPLAEPAPALEACSFDTSR